MSKDLLTSKPVVPKCCRQIKHMLLLNIYTSHRVKYYITKTAVLTERFR